MTDSDLFYDRHERIPFTGNGSRRAAPAIDPDAWKFTYDPEKNTSLTHAAITRNEGGGYGLTQALPRQSGISFGVYQCDPSGRNPHAIKAFKEIVQWGSDARFFPVQNRHYLLENYNQKNLDPKTVQRMRDIMAPLFKFKEVQDIIDRMDARIGAENLDKIRVLNQASLKYRGHPIDPFEHASGAIWGNRVKNLKDTAAAFENKMKQARTGGFMDYIRNLENFRPEPDDPKKTENRRQQFVHHLDSTMEAVQKQVKAGALKPENIPPQSIIEMNDRLEKAGSKMRFSWP